MGRFGQPVVTVVERCYWAHCRYGRYAIEEAWEKAGTTVENIHVWSLFKRQVSALALNSDHPQQIVPAKV
jgi:hypothetical protein